MTAASVIVFSRRTWSTLGSDTGSLASVGTPTQISCEALALLRVNGSLNNGYTDANMIRQHYGT